MKKLYPLILVCATICAASVSAAPHRLMLKSNARKTVGDVLALAPRASEKIWRPVSACEYIFDEGQWILLGEVKFGYDTKGNAITQAIEEDEVTMLTTSTFNDDNMVTCRIETEVTADGASYNVAKRTYVYDPIVKDFFTERMGYDWDGGNWVENYYCEINAITRNGDGNIVEIVKKVPYLGQMAPAYKSEWHYNEATGKADEYTYYANMNPTSPKWEIYEGVSYKNIEWENTDGQMTTYFDELFEGANRIKRAEVYYEDELDGYIIVEYTGEKDYVIKNTFNDPTVVAQKITRETIDDNGSFRVTMELYIDEDDNLTTEPWETETETVTYDSHANIVEAGIEVTYNGEVEYMASERYDYTYDANGNPTEITVSYYDEEEDAYIAESRTVYGEYIDVATGAGIDDIIIGEQSKRTEIYNLNGVKIGDSLEGMPSGLYIVRKGNTATKVSHK